MPLQPETITYLRRTLLRWYRANCRDLPWRRTSDPYRIWVSEIMLQQTRVAAVIKYYDRFLEAFPDLGTLARAPVDEVLARWSGLGYYRRARLLKRAAEVVLAEHGGIVPRNERELMSLPGIGRYTAGAIRSIAFDEPAPILDGNVFRVAARFLVIDGSWTSEKDKKRFWRVAEELVPARNAGDFNQALMEWGALICTPKSPECGRCPVRRKCGALAAGRVGELPTPRERPETIAVRKAMYVMADRAGRILLEQRPAGGIMAGMYDLPGEPLAKVDYERAGRFRHSILDRRYEIEVFRATGPVRRTSARMRHWIDRHRVDEFPLTTMAKKGIKKAGK